MRFIIQTNQEIAPSVYLMRLLGDTRGIGRAGTFVQITVPGYYLRRPISVCDWQPAENGTLDIIYKVVGHGTETLSGLSRGTALDALTGLGNGFDLDWPANAPGRETPLLVGGGVGTPPLYGLCKRLLAAGKRPVVILGFHTESDIFLKREFDELKVECHLCTVDGSAGTEGLVTDGMRKFGNGAGHVFTCGPEPMLKAVHALCEAMGIGGQFSFEERLACGFGVCMGCSRKTRDGSKRVCKEGPVFRWEEIVW